MYVPLEHTTRTVTSRPSIARTSSAWMMIVLASRSIVFPARAEQSRVGDDFSVETDDPQSGEVTLSELHEDTLRVLCVQTIASLKGRGQEPPFLGHRALLRHQEMPLVGVEEEHPADWQEDKKDVESQQSQ